MSQPPYAPGQGSPYAPGPPGPEPGMFEPRQESDTIMLSDDDNASPPPSGPPAPAGYPAPQPAERDRVWPHLLWEVLLLLAVGGAVALVFAENDDALTQGGVIIRLAIYLFLGSALAFSMRAAVPNLAVGGVASATGALVAWLVNEQDYGVWAAAGVAVLAALGVGIALTVVVVLFHTPAWAASLGALALLTGAISALISGRAESLTSDDVPNVQDQKWVWLAVAILISVVGGLLWAVPGLRRSLGGTRRADRDPGRRPGGGAAAGAALALIGSTVLASVSGVLEVFFVRSSFVSGVDSSFLLVLGGVLIGGVSAFGRRGGIFGTVLGIALLTLLLEWTQLSGWESYWFVLVAGIAIVVGLIVNRILEAAGRRTEIAPQPQQPPPYQY